MEGTNLMRVAAHVRLNRRQDGLAISTGASLADSLESAQVIARYFLAELGLSPNMVSIVYGSLKKNRYFTGLPGQRPSEGYPVLAIDELCLFPCDARSTRWCVVPPYWVPMPDLLPDPDRELALPIYLLRDYKKDASVRRPLYEALLFAIQTHLMENLRRDFYGVLKAYLDELPLTVYQTEEVENEYAGLVLPTLRMLLHNLPCLTGYGEEKITATIGRDMLTVENALVRFSWTRVPGIWRLWYYDQNSLKGWIEIDPPAQAPSQVAQVMARSDFTGCFFRSVPHLIARRLKEVETPILLNKTWSRGED